MPSFPILDAVDVYQAQKGVRDFAYGMGFIRIESQELAIVASELASNILKYGTRGEIVTQAVMGDAAPAMEIVAVDYGPPFANLDAAIKDGWDDNGPIDPLALLKRKGIGGGLGAVIRLTDSFRVVELQRGKQIITRRNLRDPESVRRFRLRT